jgi:hypothetical protein
VCGVEVKTEFSGAKSVSCLHVYVCGHVHPHKVDKGYCD